MKQQESTLEDFIMSGSFRKLPKKDLEGLTSFVKIRKKSSSIFVRSYKKSVMENLYVNMKFLLKTLLCLALTEAK